MSQTMFMFDDINTSLMPPGAFAYAGYVDGRWPNFSTLQQMFPAAHLLSITVFGNKADCCDVEAGDMTNSQVYNWFTDMQKDGVWKPCVYTSAGNLKAMQATMTANGFARNSYRLWSAHYTGSPHLCAPNTCGYGADQADATQFTDMVRGVSLDESVLTDGFFPSVPSINPVGNFHYTRRGFTSMDLAWNTDPGAAQFVIKTYRARSGALKPRSTVVTTGTTARVGHLWPRLTYKFRIRAEPGHSVGADAELQATTR